jgi:hypothetical protein
LESYKWFCEPPVPFEQNFYYTNRNIYGHQNKSGVVEGPPWNQKLQ